MTDAAELRRLIDENPWVTIVSAGDVGGTHPTVAEVGGQRHPVGEHRDRLGGREGRGG